MLPVGCCSLATTLVSIVTAVLGDCDLSTSDVDVVTCTSGFRSLSVKTNIS